MNKMTAALLATLLCANASADEYYEFHRVRCSPEFSEILIERVSFYNIGNYVWPPESNTWAGHVAAMKRLEREHGLYVFDEGYGYYDQEPISITCGRSKLDIEFQKGAYTERGWEGEPRQVKSNPMARFFYEGKLVSQGVYLGTYGITRLRIYYGGGRSGLIDACTGNRCEWLSPNNRPLGPEDYANMLLRP